MVPTIKAEFKKLLTVRSTYLITVLVMVLTGLFTYLGTSAVYEYEDLESSSQSLEGPPPKSETQPEDIPTPRLSKTLPKEEISFNILDTIRGISLLVSIVVLLLMAHEFRFNTLTYTLTSSNSRSKVLLAKIVAGSVYTVITTLMAVGLTVAITYLAVSMKGLELPPQEINWITDMGRWMAYTIGFSLLGLALITLVRNLTAAVAGLFLLPTIDSIAGAILREHNMEAAKLLPFSAIDRVISNGAFGEIPSSLPSVLHSAVVFAVYLAVFWAITWYLFLRHDAA